MIAEETLPRPFFIERRRSNRKPDWVDFQERLELVATFLAKADIRLRKFPHFSALMFNLDVDWRSWLSRMGPVELHKFPCEGKAENLDQLLCHIARELPKRKITFGWMDTTRDGSEEDEDEDESDEEGQFVGGEVFLGRLFPSLNANGMIDMISGVSRKSPELTWYALVAFTQLEANVTHKENFFGCELSGHARGVGP